MTTMPLRASTEAICHLPEAAHRSATGRASAASRRSRATLIVPAVRAPPPGRPRSPPRRASCRGSGRRASPPARPRPHAVAEEHHRPRGDDRRHVGGEQQRRLPGVVVAPHRQQQSGDGQGRHQGDGDRDAGQGVGDVGAHQRERADRARGQRGEQIDEAGADPGGHLAVGGEAVGGAATQPSSMPIATTARAPPSTSSTQRTTWRRAASTRARAVPRIGVISGATIIAPITVAVESPTTPALAMTAASTSSPRSGSNPDCAGRVR